MPFTYVERLKEFARNLSNTEYERTTPIDDYKRQYFNDCSFPRVEELDVPRSSDHSSTLIYDASKDDRAAFVALKTGEGKSGSGQSRLRAKRLTLVQTFTYRWDEEGVVDIGVADPSGEYYNVETSEDHNKKLSGQGGPTCYRFSIVKDVPRAQEALRLRRSSDGGTSVNKLTSSSKANSLSRVLTKHLWYWAHLGGSCRGPMGTNAVSDRIQRNAPSKLMKETRDNETAFEKLVSPHTLSHFKALGEATKGSAQVFGARSVNTFGPGVMDERSKSGEYEEDDGGRCRPTKRQLDGFLGFTTLSMN
ncbi:hypothetical protein BDN72DRAFT_884135 [Pluteus cervinus]|uniref:Uncharacterized protein n=1 Tax=Pluteus cervinus TaxID=181527 RepID=A0ACD3A0H0_9AGAR|nr:hypothetical protein BDN72DRAFT_884135 [Pluteus cervinus]